MKRLLEPELMDDSGQVAAYAAADFSLGDESFLDHLEKSLFNSGKQIDHRSLIVDLGCGPGQITQKIAMKWPEAKILGIDGSRQMLAIAEKKKNEGSFKRSLSNLEYVCTTIAELAQFSEKLIMKADVVVSNSLLHHLHDPSQFWKATKNMAGEDCLFFHRDLRRPSTEQKTLALQRKHLSDAPSILIRDFLASMRAAFTVKEVLSQLQLDNLSNLKVIEIDDRYLEVMGIYKMTAMNELKRN